MKHTRLAKLSLLSSIGGITALGIALGLIAWNNHHPISSMQKNMFGSLLIIGLLAELLAIAAGMVTRQRTFGKYGLTIGLWVLCPLAFATMKEILRQVGY